MRTRMLLFVGIVLLMLALGGVVLRLIQFPGKTYYSVTREALLLPTSATIEAPAGATVVAVEATPTLVPTGEMPLDLTLTLAASAAAMATPMATPTSPLCLELISNGGFETNEGWTISNTDYDAAYTDSVAHSGTRSMRLGIEDAARNLFSFSSVEQRVTIPGEASTARLSFWYQALRLHSGEALPSDTGKDYGYVVAFDAGGRRHNLSFIRQAQADWMRLNLLPFAGQTIVLRFGVYNDGQRAAMAIYLDDISLQVCQAFIPVSADLPTMTATNTPVVPPSTGTPEMPATPTPVQTTTPMLSPAAILMTELSTDTPVPTTMVEAEWPKKMEVDCSDSIRISLKRTTEHLFTPTIETPDHTVIAATPIPFGTPGPLEGAWGPDYKAYARANLAGAAFRISPPITEYQLLEQSEIKWVWNIMPEKPGPQTINASIQVKWEPSGSDGETIYRQIWDSQLDIFVEKPLIATGQLNAFSLFSGFVGSAFSVPFLYERIKERREKRQKNKESKPKIYLS
jgi:hypothetical protein